MSDQAEKLRKIVDNLKVPEQTSVQPGAEHSARVITLRAARRSRENEHHGEPCHTLSKMGCVW